MTLPVFAQMREQPGARVVIREHLANARRVLGCCASSRRYVVHAWQPTQDWDPDYTVVECQGCGAVFTIGDVAGMHDYPPCGLLHAQGINP